MPTYSQIRDGINVRIANNQTSINQIQKMIDDDATGTQLDNCNTALAAANDAQANLIAARDAIQLNIA